MSAGPLSSRGPAVPGTSVPSSSLVSPGGPQGQQGIQGPTGVSADAGNIATLGSDNLILVPQSTLWNMRLRSFNALGNPNMEVGQQDVASAVTVGTSSSRSADRWFIAKTASATLGATTLRNGFGAMGSPPLQIPVPGTNFFISNVFLRITLTTAQATLAAGDLLWLNQLIEGPYFRELQGDVHSCSLLVRSSVAGLKFGVAFRDPTPVLQSVVKLATIPSANTWTLIPFPNLPIWPNGGAFNSGPGNIGYQLSITLAAGSTWTAPANDIWQSGNFVGALGQSNFAASPVNSTFDIAFAQHEPGPQCTTLIDKPFTQNYDECLRYYCKSYEYVNKPGTPGVGGDVRFIICASFLNWALGHVAFSKTLAKAPTVSFYATDGTANAATIFAATASNLALSGSNSTSKGISAIAFGANRAVGEGWTVHYAADTGW